VISKPAEELNCRLIYGNKPQFSISCSYSIIPPLKRQAISVFFTKGNHIFLYGCYKKYNNGSEPGAFLGQVLILLWDAYHLKCSAAWMQQSILKVQIYVVEIS
jgi:hypothetical protein